MPTQIEDYEKLLEQVHTLRRDLQFLSEELITNFRGQSQASQGERRKIGVALKKAKLHVNNASKVI